MKACKGALRRPACKPLHNSFGTVFQLLRVHFWRVSSVSSFLENGGSLILLVCLSFGSVSQQLASFLRKLPSCLPSSLSSYVSLASLPSSLSSYVLLASLPSSFSSYVSLANFLKKLPSCLPSNLSSYVSLASLPSSLSSYVSLASFLRKLPSCLPAASQTDAAPPPARAARARPQTASQRNASPSHSFQAQRLLLKQLPSAALSPQTASEPFASALNSFQAQPLALNALKQLPSAASPQTASEPFASSQTASKALRLHPNGF